MHAKTTFFDGRVTLHAGDCLAVMATLPDASVDAVCCDPPYHLTSIVDRFGADNASPAKHGSDGAFTRASRGFMGKVWDGGDVAFQPETWAHCLRVLKPGGYLAAFSATRNYDLMTAAIRAAGFEVRDSILEMVASDTAVGRFLETLAPAQVEAFFRCLDESQFGGLLAWVYGTGFPKSHNVAKALQRRRCEDAAPVRVICRAIRAAMDTAGLKSKDLVEHFEWCHPRLIDHWAARDTDSQPACPTVAQWDVLVEVLDPHLDRGLEPEVHRLNERKGEAGDAWTEAEILGEHDGEPGGFTGERFSANDRSIREMTDEAAAWQGWGTALKPAWEPIVLARKPLDGRTVAECCLEFGTGALNVGACKVGTEKRTAAYSSLKPAANNKFGSPEVREARRGLDLTEAEYEGRYPANIVHDGSAEVEACFPTTTSGLLESHHAKNGKTSGIYGDFAHNDTTGLFGDAGSASRFFYSSKADADDRNGSNHPTVKPVDLMRWLVRLLCRKGGTVLDPFAGTGTTGEAAYWEGCNAILIEREAEYQADIAKRMSLVLAGPEERKRARTKLDAPDGLPLFGAGPQDAPEPKKRARRRATGVDVLQTQAAE